MEDNKKSSVLVVDDSEPMLDTLVEILGDSYNLSVVTSGEAALEVLPQFRPDLILLDIIMPGMDGYEVCRRLQSNPETETIPIIFLTAKSEADDEAFGFQLGSVDYITKPFSPNIVQLRVKNHIELADARKKLLGRNRQLEESVKLREEVESITRHDLKNPLCAMFAALDYLPYIGELNSQQKETVDLIKEAAHNILSMINSSLDLFKMERGTYRLNALPVDMRIVFKRLRQEQHTILLKKRLDIQMKYPPPGEERHGLDYVYGEELLCYSLFANLLNNAIEASPPDETITIMPTVRDGLVCITIDNKGAVPEVIRSTFFDKYVTMGKEKGTGLGTYSAWLMATTMNGRIEMDTPANRYTSVSVFLPRWQPD